MSLNEQDRNALVVMYWEKAEQTISEAKIAIDNKAWSMAANRIYYACFHAVTALLVSDEHEVSSHIGAKINFGKYYVKEGLASPEQGHLFSQLASLREKADYDIYFKATEDEINKFYPASVDFIQSMKLLLNRDNA